MSLQQLRSQAEEGVPMWPGGSPILWTQDDGGGLPQGGTLGAIMNFGTACQPCGPVQLNIGIDMHSLLIAP